MFVSNEALGLPTSSRRGTLTAVLHSTKGLDHTTTPIAVEPKNDPELVTAHITVLAEDIRAQMNWMGGNSLPGSEPVNPEMIMRLAKILMIKDNAAAQNAILEKILAAVEGHGTDQAAKPSMALAA